MAETSPNAKRTDVPEAERRFVVETGVAGTVAALAEPVLANMGYRLVLVRLSGGKNAILEIMAERPDGTLTIEDCEAITHQISPVLDVHDPIAGSYRLQVSSPGIDRPLVRPADFERWAGHEARIELCELFAGRKRLRGTLAGFAAGEARIEVELGAEGRTIVGLPVGLIASAKLVLTDTLVRASLERAKARHEGAQARARAMARNQPPQSPKFKPKQGFKPNQEYKPKQGSSET